MTFLPIRHINIPFNPSLPSGYILVGACLKDTNALAGKVALVYCNASSSNGTHRINLRLLNISNDVVSITANMGITFYLFVKNDSRKYQSVKRLQIVNTGMLTVGQYLHIYIPIVLK